MDEYLADLIVWSTIIFLLLGRQVLTEAELIGQCRLVYITYWDLKESPLWEECRPVGIFSDN